jgi:hypothetical protein
MWSAGRVVCRQHEPGCSTMLHLSSYRHGSIPSTSGCSRFPFDCPLVKTPRVRGSR